MTHKSISRRGFLYGSAGVTAGLALASCSSGSASKNPTGGGGGSIQVADPSYLKTSYKGAMDAVTAAFTAATGAKVQQVAPPTAQYTGAVLTQLNAGSPPDVIRIDDPAMSTYVDRGWLLPLDDVLKNAGVSTANLVPSEADAVVGGKTYGIVKESNPRAFIYNQKLFSAAGADVPTDVASFDKAIRKVRNKSTGVYGVGFATKQGDATTLFIQIMPYVLGFGGQFFKDGKATAEDPKTIEALEFLQRLWRDDQVPRGLDAVGANNLVTEGKVASMINGSFIIVDARGANPAVGAALTTAVNPLPSGVVMRATAWWGVPTKAKQPDLGKKYLVALLDPKVQQQFQEQTGVIVARREGVTPEFLKKNPWYQVIVDNAFKNSTTSYFPQVGPNSNKAVSTAAEAVLSVFYQNADVATAMRTVQPKLEALVG